MKENLLIDKSIAFASRVLYQKCMRKNMSKFRIVDFLRMREDL
jgi:hypothetical protein